MLGGWRLWSLDAHDGGAEYFMGEEDNVGLQCFVGRMKGYPLYLNMAIVYFKKRTMGRKERNN